MDAVIPHKEAVFADRGAGTKGRYYNRPSVSPTGNCIQKNNYDESKCKAEIDALYECCNAFYEKNGDTAKTVSCPKANLLRLKMRQLAQEKGSK
ncbi:Cx9C motif-containing protein 4, mitochondrial [Pseudogymnoascus australis]